MACHLRRQACGIKQEQHNIIWFHHMDTLLDSPTQPKPPPPPQSTRQMGLCRFTRLQMLGFVLVNPMPSMVASAQGSLAYYLFNYQKHMFPSDLVLWSTHFVVWYENTICSENSSRLAVQEKAYCVSGLSQCFPISIYFISSPCWPSRNDPYNL